MTITIHGRHRTVISPWMTVVERSISRDGSEPQLFHSIAVHDYISVLAVTEDGRVPLVRQYRPTLERVTLELPGGLLDGHAEDPAEAVARELYEETGYRAPQGLQLIGRLDPDSGRLENRLWAFHAAGVQFDTNWTAEPGVESLLLPTAELLDWVRDGRFCHAPHLAIVALGLVKKLL